MNFKFNRRKINYIVKPEERIVIGWIDTLEGVTGVREEMKDYVKIDWILPAFDVEDVWEQDNHIIKAVSKCDDMDDFDEKIGKKIVADILEKKYHILIMRKYKQCEREAIKLLDSLYAQGIEHSRRLKELQKRIDVYNE